MRGFSNFNFRRKRTSVTLRRILPLIISGIDEIHLDLLLQRGIVRAGTREIKIIGNATLPRAVSIRADAFSSGAIETIRRAGGQAICQVAVETPGGDVGGE
jgi:large subunit ribosomal protein L15